jgi:hypothetical protein
MRLVGEPSCSVGRRTYITESFVKADGAFEMGMQQNSTKRVGTAYAGAFMRERYGLYSMAGALLTLTGICVLSNLGIDGIDLSFPMKSNSRTVSIQVIFSLCEREKKHGSLHRRSRPLTRTRLHDESRNPRQSSRAR